MTDRGHVRIHPSPFARVVRHPGYIRRRRVALRQGERPEGPGPAAGRVGTALVVERDRGRERDLLQVAISPNGGNTK